MTLGFFCLGYVPLIYQSLHLLMSQVLGSVALTTLNGILTARTPVTQEKVQTTEEIELAMRLGFASRELYQVCLGTTKLGICTFYLRIFQDRVSKVIIRSTMFFIVIFTLGLSLGIFFQCEPISGMNPRAIILSFTHFS